MKGKLDSFRGSKTGLAMKFLDEPKKEAEFKVVDETMMSVCEKVLCQEGSF